MATNTKNSKNKLNELFKTKKKSLNSTVDRYIKMGELLLFAKEKNLDPLTLINWENLQIEIDEAKFLKETTSVDYIDFLAKKYGRIRMYSKSLLNSFDFKSVDSAKSLIKGIQHLKSDLDSKKRFLGASTPTDFLSERWKKHVFASDGRINRKFYELALLDTLKVQIQSGNVAVTGSSRYKSFDSYLFSKEEWENTEKFIHRLAIPLDFEEYIQERQNTLTNSILSLAKELPNSPIAFEKNNQIHIRPLETIVPEEAEHFSKLVGSYLPQTRLTDIVAQVGHWIPLFKEFTNVSTGKPYPRNELKLLYITIIALGTNIGLSKMADHTPGVTYEQLARVARWYLQDENIEKANTLLVNFQHRLPIAAHWGDGSTSASDGIRRKVPVSSLQASYDGKFGYKKDVTIYRHSADQYQTYSTKVINSNDRDAIHVFDGILKNKTDLSILEHYTDTHGYTDQIFGFAHVIGVEFAPRIKNISSMRLYHLGGVPDNLTSIIQRKIDVEVIRDNYQDVLRLMHSMRELKADSSLILSRLGSYARKNSLAKALQEMGRIEKTIFLSNYYIDELARRRTQKGLNKAEAINALSRKVGYGQNDELHEPSYEGQSQIAKLSDLLLNIITVWNSVYMQTALDKLAENEPIPEHLIAHISPIRWEHINLFGDFLFSDEQLLDISSIQLNK